jgi:hypothetical protein
LAAEYHPLNPLSYDLAVRHTAQRLSDADASKSYGDLCDSNVEGVAANPAIEAFYDELTARHPEIDDIPEEEIDNTDLCPWSIAFDRSPGRLIMPCVWSKAEYVDGLIRELAAEHGLAVFDPQQDKVTYPDGA